MQQDSSFIKDIIQYIQRSNTPFSEWYVGIAEDALARLFQGHGVNKDMDYWIYRDCINANAAREVEQFIIMNYHTDGGSGGGNDNSRFVYAYKKEAHTRESY